MKFALISLRLISSMTFLQLFCGSLLLRLLRRGRFQILCIIWCLIPCQPIGAYSLSFHLPINKICILGGLMACCVHEAVSGFLCPLFSGEISALLFPQYANLCRNLAASALDCMVHSISNRPHVQHSFAAFAICSGLAYGSGPGSTHGA